MANLPNKRKWKKLNKTFYIVLLVHEELQVETKNMNFVGTLPLKLTWADGQVGAMPVFTDHSSALKYARGDEDRIIIGNVY